MIVTRDGHIIASSIGGINVGGSGTITAGNENVTITHGLGTTPTWGTVTPSNDYATDLKIGSFTVTTCVVSYPAGVTQLDDGTFYFNVGV